MTEESTLNIEINETKARSDLDKLSRSLDKTTKAGNKTSKAVKKTGEEAKRASSGFGFLKASIAGVFTVSALTGFARVISTFQSLENSLGVVFGSMERGVAVMGDIKDLAATTPFSVEALTESVIKLRAAGIEPTTAQLTLFSDTASVTGDVMGSLQAITDLFARTTAGGLGLEDLNRLADRGIPVFTILQERLGLARLEISELGKTAQGAQQILGALTDGLQERFGGASEQAASLLKTQISNLGDAWDRFLDSIGKSGGLALLGGIVAGITTSLEFMSENLDTVAVAMSGLATLAIPALIRGIQALTLAIASNPIGLIVVGITAAITALYHFRGVIFDTIIKAFEVWIPNAVDHTRAALLRVELKIAETINVVLTKVNELGNKLAASTPDWLKGWLGIEGKSLSLSIDTATINSNIDQFEAQIAARIKNFKAPPRPDFLGIDEEKDDNKVQGLSTGGSLTGNLITKQEEVADILFTKQKETELRRLEAVELSLLTEEERLFDSYANRQFIVEEAFESELISEERRQELLLNLKTQYEANLLNIEKKGWTERQKFVAKSAAAQTATVVGELVNMTAGVAQHNKTMFEINKVAGIANAIVGAHESFNRTMAAYPYPLNVTLAGLSLAAAMAQVDAIRSTSFGGGGAGTAPSGVTGGLGAPAAQIIPQPQREEEDTSRTITINVDGNVYANDDFRSAMVEALELAQQNDEVIIHAS